MGDRAPSLAEAINTAVELGLRNLYTMIPARVVKWEADKQRANCQILIKHVTEDEDGEREVKSWPVVPGVPVQFMGAGDFRITVPVDVGTIGMLIFSHLSLDKWLSGDNSEVDPEFDHDHALADAVFLPGLRTFGSPLSSVASDVIELSAGGTTQFAALSNIVNDMLSLIRDYFDSHVHTCAGSGSPSSAPTAIISNQIQDVAASKVKVE